MGGVCDKPLTYIELLAHSSNKAGNRQTLADHLNHVAALAEKFAAPFSEEATARFVALTHDLGKAKTTWQERLLQLEAGLNPAFDQIKSDHKMAGAAYAYRFSASAALAVAGHHGGVPNLSALRQEMATAKWQPSLDEAVRNLLQAGLKTPELLQEIEDEYFRVLMLFSCLVDADSIDTSSHFLLRLEVPQFDGMSVLSEKMHAARPGRMNASAEVTAMRQVVRKSCIGSATKAKGFFSLHAPTGSGKTISSALFALNHATHHGMSRFIYVAPYRTIIDQTASVYESILGEQNVLAHHSTSDFWTGSGQEDRVQRQIAENWDVPVVVTTAEQFFESLYSGRPGASRKLHNIANSVIVIDEPQALPVSLLTPCFAALKALVREYGCTVVLATATMLPLEHEGLLGQAVTCILDSEIEFVRVAVDLDRFRRSIWSGIAAFMSEQRQVLAISNTKAGALRIYESLPRESRVFISTWLSPVHRQELIQRVRTALNENEPCHVSSTQVVEAGVDFDFPDVMLREKAPLDSILQAFGRCNRNGLGHGLGYVFAPAEGNRLPDYRLGISCVNELLYEQRRDPYDAQTLRDYYTMLYSHKNLDANDVMQKVEELAFETIRDGEDGFRLIKTPQEHLVVSYGREEELADLREAVAAIQAATKADDVMPRWATRRLQKHVVSVYPQTLAKLEEAYPLAVTHLVLNYHLWTGAYSATTGLGNVIASLSNDEEV